LSKVLYLSYDGMCDPLGGSQVLPYLVGLAERGHQISLISFEKPGRTDAERQHVACACAEAGIAWHPLPYHKRPPVLSTMLDVHRMRGFAKRLHRRVGFDLLHCRSYLTALAGLSMKRRLGIPFIFDMRGFWADERVEGGLWNLRNPLFLAVYRYFKRREAEFLAEADQIVSLTQAGKDVILGWRKDPDVGPPITVIPCCVDFDAFPAVDRGSREAARKRLGIAPNSRVAAYLGSLGTWYLSDEMLDFFRVQVEQDPNSFLLIVTRDRPEGILASVRARGIAEDRVIVRPASRSDVPKLIAAADYGLFFIKPVFSKLASSPTKMGEFLALELPVVTNTGVGDVDRIVADTGGGVVVRAFDDIAYRDALRELDLLPVDKERWRAATRRWLDLDAGIDRYDALYRTSTESLR